MATAIFRRVVFDHKSKAIEVADNGREFPDVDETRSSAISRRCLPKANSGRSPKATHCDAPFPWLQADHVKPHSKGGPTKLSNGQIRRCLPKANSRRLRP